MTKFEYSDFYKFITSVGLALISLSFLIPWLFLREPFDLFRKSDDILLLIPLAQSIIVQRQLTINYILKLIPIISIFLFLSGLITLVCGSINWYRKTQKIEEKIKDLNLKLLEKQLGTLSPEAVKARQEDEIKAELESESTDIAGAENVLQQSNINRIVENASRIEEKVIDFLKSCFRDTHLILTDRKLGNIFFDIVMLSRIESMKDYLFEVKYIQKGFRYSWMRDNVLKVVYASQAYQQETARQSVSMLFIVASDSARPQLSVDVQKYIMNIKREIGDAGTEVAIIYLNEKDLYEVSCTWLKSKLSQTIS